MDKLRIGIINDEQYSPTRGGGFTYYHTLLNAIDVHTFHPELEIVHLVFSKKKFSKRQFKKQVIYVDTKHKFSPHYFLLKSMSFIEDHILKRRGVGNSRLKKMTLFRNRRTIKILNKENIDLVYYLKPEENILDFPLLDFPFITTHWDLAHKSMYPFPEVSQHGNYEIRDMYYNIILDKAFLIFCESNAGVEELKKYYSVNPDKVKALPIFSGEVVTQNVTIEQQNKILIQFQIQKNKYYLYPAQFWALKNHYNLIHAFSKLVKEDGHTELKLVLCGGDKGNLNYIRDLIKSLELEDRVVIAGFISNEELYTFYNNALALVMPTFLGPTNIPLIEAAELNCAVICSDLKGHKEILGEGALYFDPANAADIAHNMQIVLNAEFRNNLISTAQELIKKSPFNIKKTILLLQDILLALKPIRKAWGNQIA